MRNVVSLASVLVLVFACHSGKSVRTSSVAPKEPIMADRPNEIVYAESMMPTKASELAAQPIAKYIASPVLNETEYKGQLAYTNECARCHDLPNLSQYPKTAWAKLLPDMQRKGKTDQATMDLISAYVYANYEK